MFLGCELIPDALDPPPNELARKNYLQKGDTLHIPIESLINENSHYFIARTTYKKQKMNLLINTKN